MSLWLVICRLHGDLKTTGMNCVMGSTWEVYGGENVVMIKAAIAVMELASDHHNIS